MKIKLILLAACFIFVFLAERIGAQTNESVTYTFTTLSGSAGKTGSSDGKGNEALFNGPAGLRLDASGNLFVADSGNNTIRKITPDGAVTTIAGEPGKRGGDDGRRGDAHFFNPAGVAVDHNGCVYVADASNNTIRKIEADGYVITFAGKWRDQYSNDNSQCLNFGLQDGPANKAAFFCPDDLVLDANSNLFIADTNNNAIRKITPDGLVTTLAGKAGQAGSKDGVGGDAQFNSPQGIALDANGMIYIADTSSNTIRKITPDGIVTTLAGKAGEAGSKDGTGGNARFKSPQGVGLDVSGNVYVVDSGNNILRKITPNGLVTTIAGQVGKSGSKDGPGNQAQFNNPCDIVLDGDGNIYVTDLNNNTIRKGTPSPPSKAK